MTKKPQLTIFSRVFEWRKCWTVNQNWIERSITSFQRGVCLIEIRYCNSTDLSPCLCFAACTWIFSFLSSSAVKKLHEITEIYARTLWNNHRFYCRTLETSDAQFAELQVKALHSRLAASGSTSNQYLWKLVSKRHIIKGDSWCRKVPDNS